MGAVSQEVVPVNASTASLPLSLGQLHSRFLAIVPRIEQHGQVSFRHLRGPDLREDAVCEMVALCGQWFARLAERGKDATEFASALATFAARAVKSGRRLHGMGPIQDVLSPRAQQRRGFVVASLRDGRSLHGNVLDEALHDNTQTPVPEQVSFRCDFPAWRCMRTERDRRLLDDLLVGVRPGAVGEKYGLSPSRVSQLCREFHADWDRFCASAADGR
jgi:hypothetical protein